MASGREHMIGGTVASVVTVVIAAGVDARSGFGVFTGPGQVAGVLGLAVPIGLIYGLLPDIDLRGTLSRWLGILGWVITWIVRRVSRLTHGRAHRGLTHRPWLILLCALPWLWVHPVLAVAATVAGWSHLLLDRPVFAPLWRKLYRTD